MATLIGVGVLVFGALLIAFQLHGSGSSVAASTSTKAFFSNDDGKTWFTDLATKLPPFDHSGSQAYRVEVFRCGPSGKPFVVCLESYSSDDKARIVEETLAPGAVVSDVARRHGLSPQQLFTWRREARCRPRTAEAAPVFVPAVIQEAVGDGEAKTDRKATRRRRGCQTSGIIEIEIDGVTVRVGSGADAKTVAAVIRALKAGT